MENQGMLESIILAFNTGGLWMWAILVAQIFSVAIIIERVAKLYWGRKLDQTDMVSQYESDIKHGHLEDVVRQADRHDNKAPVARVVAAGAQAALDMGGREEIQARMDEVLLSENAKLRKRTGLLSMIGNVGTLLGLLGTIVGLIKAFASTGSSATEGGANLLAQGVSMAMNTTAYGLIVAIPAVVAYGLLQSRASQLSEDLNQAALKAFNLLSFKYESAPKRKPRVRGSN